MNCSLLITQTSYLTSRFKTKFTGSLRVVKECQTLLSLWLNLLTLQMTSTLIYSLSLKETLCKMKRCAKFWKEWRNYTRSWQSKRTKEVLLGTLKTLTSFWVLSLSLTTKKKEQFRDQNLDLTSRKCPLKILRNSCKNTLTLNSLVLRSQFIMLRNSRLWGNSFVGTS